MINKAISKLFGKITHKEYPEKMQNFINKKYVDFFKVDLSEFEDSSKYKSLHELFTREFVQARKIDENPKTFLSPCDSLCLNLGNADKLKAESIKGFYYNIDELLGELITEEEKALSLTYVNLYLSPKDYHHYHAPAKMQIINSEYFGGNLYSVSKSALKFKKNLYSENERVVLRCKLENGTIFWLVFVGALNVGKMLFDFDERLTSKDGKNQVYSYNNLQVEKGQHLGNFDLGSTILIISPENAITYKIQAEEKISFAQVIGEIN